MSWKRGRAVIERLISNGQLERVTPSDDVARRLLADPAAHLALAADGIEQDPTGVLQLSYDAARKAATALLAVQGLRPTTRGGHIVVIDAVRAQFDDQGDTAVFGRLHRLRRHHNASEYPDSDSPTVTADDARHALNVATLTLDTARRLLQHGRLGAFEPGRAPQ